jgi:chromosome segregation ATPase
MLALLKTKEGMIGALVLFVLIGGAAWLNGAIQSAEARGEARLMAAQAQANWEALLDSVDTWTAREAAWDSTHAALTANLDSLKGVARVASARARQATLGARATLARLEDSLETLTAEDVVEIAAAVDTLEAAEAACNAALENCEELVQATESRIYDIQAQLEQTLNTSRHQALTIERLQDLQRPRMNALGYAGWIVAIAEAALLALSLAGG